MDIIIIEDEDYICKVTSGYAHEIRPRLVISPHI